MGDDETALLRLWREKRGEVEPEDLSGNNLIVQLGTVTQQLNRHWYVRNTGQIVTEVQRRRPPGTEYRIRPRDDERELLTLVFRRL